jgi:hypothetical protein
MHEADPMRPTDDVPVDPAEEAEPAEGPVPDDERPADPPTDVGLVPDEERPVPPEPLDDD